MCGNNNNFIVSNKGKQLGERNGERVREIYIIFCKSHEFACLQRKRVSRDIGLLGAYNAVILVHTYILVKNKRTQILSLNYYFFGQTEANQITFAIAFAPAAHHSPTCL